MSQESASLVDPYHSLHAMSTLLQHLRHARRRRQARPSAAAAAAGSSGPTSAPAPADAGGTLPSLIPLTLEQLEADEELQALHARVKQQGQAALTEEEVQRLQRSLDALGVPPFAQVLQVGGRAVPAGVLGTCGSHMGMAGLLVAGCRLQGPLVGDSGMKALTLQVGCDYWS